MDLILNNLDMEPRLSRNGKRLWSKAQKRLIVSEAMRPGMSVSKVSRRYDINANLIFRWIKAAGIEVEKKGQLIPIGVIAPPLATTDKQERPAKTPCVSAVPPSIVPKLIEIELRNGAKIRIDGDVRLPVLQSVLKLVRGLA